MLIGQVVGRATSTIKHPSLQGWKLLIVQPLGANRKPDGDPVLAVDTLDAGTRDVVLLTSDGKTVRTLMGNNTPTRWSVMGICD
ncbi:MAG: EutN/CcmL family microcompartment protein [Planctomycetales bacterium]